MNHLEQLVSEWLQYNGYIVKVSVMIEKRGQGGYGAELDVVGFNPVSKHLIHVECSLDADSWEKRRAKFSKKFERQEGYLNDVFKGLVLPPEPDQVVLLQFASPRPEVGGVRLVTGRQFIREIFDGLKGKTPANEAVSPTLPLIRTLQLAADAVAADAENIVSPPRLVRHSGSN